jgi:hypothetical protein
VACGRERGAEDGADTAGADDAHAEAGVLVVRSCRGAAPLQPDVSRELIADGECVTGRGGPQRLDGVS